MALQIALIIVFLTSLLFHYVLRPAFTSPLSKLPLAHPTSSFLPTWIWWNRCIGHENRSIFAAHQRQGAIVRLAPNEVSVASLDGLRKIYAGGFERTEWFLQFRNYVGTPSLFTMLDRKKHATRRRILTPIYSKSYLLGSSDFQALAPVLLFERLLPFLDDAARTGEGIDVFELGCATAAEFTSAYQVGIGNGIDLVGRGKEERRRRYLDDCKRKVRNLKGREGAVKELEEQCLEMCKKAEDFLRLNSSASEERKANMDREKGKTENIVQEGSESPTTYPVVYAQLSSSIPAREHTTSPQETFRLVASELLDNIEAAREGIGITLTYALYQLSQQPAIQSALRDELVSLKSSFTYPLRQHLLSTSMLRKLDSLPLLNAVLTETLRLHVPVPGPQRRVVPEGGAVIEGYFIPTGVTISSSPYCMHRRMGAYPGANLWKPERWMEIRDAKDEQVVRNIKDGSESEKGKGKDDPQRWFLAFGNGGMMCIGIHFALVVLKLLLASIYANFTTTIVDDEGIEQRDDILASPVGDKLILRFNYDAL